MARHRGSKGAITVTHNRIERGVKGGEDIFRHVIFMTRRRARSSTTVSPPRSSATVSSACVRTRVESIRRVDSCRLERTTGSLVATITWCPGPSITILNVSTEVLHSTEVLPRGTVANPQHLLRSQRALSQLALARSAYASRRAPLRPRASDGAARARAPRRPRRGPRADPLPPTCAPPAVQLMIKEHHVRGSESNCQQDSHGM